MTDDARFLCNLAAWLKDEHPDLAITIVRLRKIAMNLPEA